MTAWNLFPKPNNYRLNAHDIIPLMSEKPIPQGGLEETPIRKQYRETLERFEKGTFPVTEGSIVFRVVNGCKLGRFDGIPNTGDRVEDKYATPHPYCVRDIFAQNDYWQLVEDGSPQDMEQIVVLVKVDSFRIPEPDRTHDLTGDKDQVVVSGEVIGVTTPAKFNKHYNYDYAPDRESKE